MWLWRYQTLNPRTDNIMPTYCDCPNALQWSRPLYSEGDQEWFCFACDRFTNVFTPAR